MDSINKNQVEENKENLTFSAALRKLKELAEKANSCFFSTSKALGPSHGTRPMSVQEIDDEGNLWFLSANDSFKNKEIAIAPAVSLYFQGSSHADFLFLSGNATISYDKEKIKKLWNPILKTWFTEGIDDPRISIIKFRPSTVTTGTTKMAMQ